MKNTIKRLKREYTMTRKELDNFLTEKIGPNYWQYPETSMWYVKILKYLEQRKKKEIDVV